MKTIYFKKKKKFKSDFLSENYQKLLHHMELIFREKKCTLNEYNCVINPTCMLQTIFNDLCSNLIFET